MPYEAWAALGGAAIGAVLVVVIKVGFTAWINSIWYGPTEFDERLDQVTDDIIDAEKNETA
jgi:hypothetical protein